MQFWVNEQGQMLTVTDITKVEGSAYFRKRGIYNRYVVSGCLNSVEYRMSLSFDTMSGVRYWMDVFGFKLKKGGN